MGNPSPGEINSAILRFSSLVSEITGQEQVFYIQHYGVSQYYKGNQDMNLEPYQTLSPERISTPDEPNRFGGDPSMQSDAKSMLQLGPVADAFHLDNAGFDHLSKHSVDMYIGGWL